MALFKTKAEKERAKYLEKLDAAYDCAKRQGLDKKYSKPQIENILDAMARIAGSKLEECPIERCKAFLMIFATELRKEDIRKSFEAAGEDVVTFSNKHHLGLDKSPQMVVALIRAMSIYPSFSLKTQADVDYLYSLIDDAPKSNSSSNTKSNSFPQQAHAVTIESRIPTAIVRNGNCKRCGFRLTEGSKFCTNCGERVEQSVSLWPCFCHECGTKLPEGSIFCPQCGSKVESKIRGR